jgi:sugar O-acyltransferase (sialic acid O-acetyltransferase NeuD family)
LVNLKTDPNIANIVLGAGGHAREIEWMMSCLGLRTDFFAVSDDYVPIQSFIHPVIKISQIKEQLIERSSVQCYLAVGDPRVRFDLLQDLMLVSFPNDLLLDFPVLFEQKYPPSRTEIGQGTLINFGTILTCDIKLGSFVTVNRACNISHDCVLGHFVTLGVGVNLSGGVAIEDFAELGSGVTVIPGKRIGRGAMIGAGSTVITDIPPNATAVGTPCKVIKTSQDVPSANTVSTFMAQFQT